MDIIIYNIHIRATWLHVHAQVIWDVKLLNKVKINYPVLKKIHHF